MSGVQGDQSSLGELRSGGNQGVGQGDPVAGADSAIALDTFAPGSAGASADHEDGGDAALAFWSSDTCMYSRRSGCLPALASSCSRALAHRKNTGPSASTSRPLVMTVQNSLVDSLKREAESYRRMDFFEFRPFDANRVEITRNKQTMVFENVKSGQGSNAQSAWRRVSPTAKVADKDAIDALLSTLSNMRAASFVDSTAKTGLDSPAMVVAVKYDDGKKDERVTFGMSGSDVFAARLGEPGAARIDTSDFNGAINALDTLSR